MTINPESYKIRKDTMQSTIGKGNRLTLDDIARCTGGGKGIGAMISRNFNRILTLRKGEGWITKQSVSGKLDSILSTADKVTFNQKIKEALKTDLENQKEVFKKVPVSSSKLLNMKEEVKKIETISGILNDLDTANDAKNTAEAIKHIAILKQVDPMAILEASIEFNLKNKLIDEFNDFLLLNAKEPKSREDIQNSYHEYLELKASFIQMNHPTDPEKLAQLRECAHRKNLQPILFIQGNPDIEINDKKLIKKLAIGLNSSWTRAVEAKPGVTEAGPMANKLNEIFATDSKSGAIINTAKFFEVTEGEILKSDDELSSQIQRDINGLVQHNIVLRDGENVSFLNPLPIIPKIIASTPFTEFVPPALKEFAKNDPETIKKIALLLTQGASGYAAEFATKKYLTEDIEGIPLSLFKVISLRYEFETINGEKQVRIINDFEKNFINLDPSEYYIVTTHINLDNPNAAVLITEQQITEVEAKERERLSKLGPKES